MTLYDRFENVPPHLQLSDRKLKILEAIINDYIETAEPVGSRTIEKKYGLGISSATIRNEMSDLEDMGFIVQRHVSSGRVPSDLGYRLFVDHLLQKDFLEKEDQNDLQNILGRNVNEIDYLMQETAHIVSALTKCPTIISEPVTGQAKIKQMRLLPFDENSILLLIATEENYIKNHVIPVDTPPNEDEIMKMSRSINSIFANCISTEINQEKIDVLQQILGDYDDLLAPILKALETTLLSAEKTQVYMSGTKNILEFPEFSDFNKAKPLFQVLEEKERLVSFLEENSGTDLQVKIGSENSVQGMEDCTIITATYRLNDTMKGTIGIVGPTRMDYMQVISALNGVVKNIENVLEHKSKKEEKGSAEH
ncbi:MAG: heat-inducible transcriptional repressor HrcA [Bacillota bacterium]